MKFTRIDQLYLPEHHFLRPDDDCYFLREYTAGKGFAGGQTNSIVTNLKKSPLKRGMPEWRHKEQALGLVADELRALRGGLNPREACGEASARTRGPSPAGRQICSETPGGRPGSRRSRS